MKKRIINLNDYITSTHAAEIMGISTQSVMSHVRHFATEIEVLHVGAYLWINRRDLRSGAYRKAKLLTRLKPNLVDFNDLVSFAQAAQMRGVSKQAMSDLDRRGRLPIVEWDGVRLTTRSGFKGILTPADGGRGRKASLEPGNGRRHKS